MDDNPQEIPQQNFKPGMSSKAVLAIILLAIAVTAVAVYWYMQPPAAVSVSTPEEAANVSVDVARTAADLGGSLNSIQEKLSPS